MKKLTGIVLRMMFVMSVFGIIGCGGPSPDEIAKECVEYLQEANFAEMRKLSTGEMVRWLDNAEEKYSEVASLLGSDMTIKLQKTYADLKYKCGDSKIEGEKATVQMKINGQPTPIEFVKVDGDWRVEKFPFPIL